MRYLKLKGFTLVEIIVVVAIIASLSTLSIINVMRSRLAANETLAIASLRTISTACEGYKAVTSPTGYPPDLGTLGTMKPPYLNRPLATATSPPGTRGYYYTYNFESSNYYTCTATPIDSSSGKRMFFIDAAGVIKLNDIDGEVVGGY